MPSKSGPLREFIKQQTRVTAPAAVPEIDLWLSTSVTPLWQASEDFLKVHDIAPPYWAFAWPGSQALARFLLDNAHWVSGKTVLDFASGSGLAAIAASKVGAKKVFANDIDPLALAAIELNCEVNTAKIAVLGDNLLKSPSPPFDVILAGDVCYEKPMARSILSWLAKASIQGTTVLLGDPGRTYGPGGADDKHGCDPDKSLHGHLQQKLRVMAQYDIPTLLELEDAESRLTRIYLLEPLKAQSVAGGSSGSRCSIR